MCCASPASAVAVGLHVAMSALGRPAVPGGMCATSFLYFLGLHLPGDAQPGSDHTQVPTHCCALSPRARRKARTFSSPREAEKSHRECVWEGHLCGWGSLGAQGPSDALPGRPPPAMSLPAPTTTLGTHPPKEQRPWRPQCLPPEFPPALPRLRHGEELRHTRCMTVAISPGALAS